MAYIVKQNVGGKIYYYLRESVREGSKVKSKCLAYLGKSKTEATQKAKEIIKKLEEGEDITLNSKSQRILNSKLLKQPIINKEVQIKPSTLEHKKISIEELANFCKAKGFVFRSSDIYGGFAGFWDFGPLGVEFFNNLRKDWWNYFVNQKDNMIGIEASIISHPQTWITSGHVANFNVNDYLVSCKKCKKSIKIDKPDLGKIRCECGGEYEWEKAQMVEQMFKTHAGTDKTEVYLRGETAQAMFMDFKLAQQTARKQLPFGIAQIGRCFRNEIAPRDFLFRSREFHIGEFEFFINAEEKKCELLEEKHLKLHLKLLDEETQKAGKETMKDYTINEMLKQKKLDEWHAYWLAEQILWFKSLGLEEIKIREHRKDELSHYSSATFDIDYEYPFGSKEVAGNANRGQYDLTQHSKFSGEKFEIFDEKYKNKLIPRVIEPTFGMERVFLALLTKGYCKNEKEEIVLKIPPKLAPVKAAVFPIIKSDKYEKIAQEIVRNLREEWNILYDISGSIGRRYARNDEIGTPMCITIDEQTPSDKNVTIRWRDNAEQVRVPIEHLHEIVRRVLLGESLFQFGRIVDTRKKQE